MSKRKTPSKGAEEKARVEIARLADREYFRRIGRKGGKIGGAKGGKRRLETMTPAARTAQAYQAGVQGGRPREVDWDKVVKLREAGKSLKEIAAAAHCSVGTVCRIMRERRG